MDQSLALFTTALAVLVRLSIALKDYAHGMWEFLQRVGIRQPGASATVHDAVRLEQGDSVHSPRNSAKVVYSLPLVDLPGVLVDPSVLSTPCRLRLVDASAFLDAAELRIVEYDDPDLSDTLFDIGQSTVPPYAAVSYPWRDLQLNAGCVVASFSVAGAQHADPISMDVLRTACAAAREYGFDMLWLDRLCLLQTSKQDKVWQIQRMFRIYKYCSLCLVFPGGLVRLARLDDDTTWLYRAWTLQEAAAPGWKRLRLVLQLPVPSYRSYIEQRCADESYNENFRHRICSIRDEEAQHGGFVDKVVEEGVSAACDVERMLHKVKGLHVIMRFLAPEIADDYAKLPVRILPPAEANLLKHALSLGGMQLWRAAYTRSSSRPVDMVFSLMDLVGVQIPVKNFGENDRMKATIAMIQVLMRRPDAVATWLFIAPAMTPSRELSTLPEMPETSESGRAYIHTSKGRVLAFKALDAGGTDFWSSAGAPSGFMTDAGYFVFSGRGALHVSGSSTTTSSQADREIWAVVVGEFMNLNRDPDTWKLRSSQPTAPPPKGLRELTLMLIEKHGCTLDGHGLFHRIGMEREIDERKTAQWNWAYREFRVGGPGKGPRTRFDVSTSGPVFVDREEEDNTILRINVTSRSQRSSQ